MVTHSQETEICALILDELYDIKEKKGVNFNKLFKKIKERRGKFSFDTLSKYLSKMEADGRIIRVIDVNSNRKIKPTLLFKNSEIIRLRNEKSNFRNILMDANTKFYRFPKNRLTSSDLLPQFNEVIMNFLKTQMNMNVEYLELSKIFNWSILFDNFELYLVENPELQGEIKNLNDLVLLLYLNLLESSLGVKLRNNKEINFNLFFQINIYELVASVIISIIDKVQQEALLLDKVFIEKVKTPKNLGLTREDLLNLFLSHLSGERKEEIKICIQNRWFNEFSERYRKGIKI